MHTWERAGIWAATSADAPDFHEKYMKSQWKS